MKQEQVKKVNLDVDSMPLHKQLHVVRVARGMYQKDIVEAVGFDNVPRYSMIEQGKRPVPAHLMGRVKQFLYGEESE
ncbi:XRE family transcriptional regulator [Priestia sp. OVL9]|nr:XRE family transcriptional regulator [Priestia sp. OVL9]MCJ7983654.1 XRE family transcriptional regulator [Priestia sp. OVL9]